MDKGCPAEIRGFDLQKPQCAFCGAAHATCERRRSYHRNDQHIVVRIRICELCREMKRIFPSYFVDKELEVVLKLLRVNGLLGPANWSGGP